MLVIALVLASLVAQAEPSAAPPATPPTLPMPVDAKPLPAPFTPKVTPYGFLNFQYSRLDPTEPRADTSTFEFRRARIGLRGDVTKEIGFNVIWDGADSSLKDAFIALRYVPTVELRLGQFKTPFGYEQTEADTRLLWVYNSYAVQSLARGRDSRDVGAVASGKWKLGGAVSADLSGAYVNGAGPNVKDDLDEKTFWGKGGASVAVAGTTTRLGASYGYGHQVQSTGTDGKFGLQGTAPGQTLDDTYFYFHTAGADLTFDSRWAFVSAEWIQSRRHVTRYTNPTTSTTTDIGPKGWYVGAYTKSPWNAGLILRIEEALLPTSAGTALNPRWNKRYTYGAYYDVLPVTARLVLNYERDASPTAQRLGDRVILFGQVMF